MHNFTLKTFRITLLLGVLLSCFALQAQVAVPFTPRKQVSIKGDITMIGNNIVNRKTEGSKRRPARDPNDAYPFNSDENSNTANDDFNMRYIDIDGDGTTFSSSKATLTIPDASCSKVVYAALYWSATYRYNNSNDTGGRNPINAIKLKLPNASAYTAIAGTTLYDGFTGMFSANGAYACYADVTALVRGLTNPNGEYTVADIRATQGTLDGGISGGWNLFVIYENPTYPGKYITSYDGFAGVNAALGSVDVPYSGFVTVPSPLPVRAKLATAALEGDYQISGDQLLFRGGANTNPFNSLSNTKNPANNFFNSNITYLDAAGTAQDFTARTPNSGNTLGFDSDVISIPTGYLPNGATQATLQIKSTQDTYYMFFNALSVDIIEPEMRLVKTVQDIQGHDIGGQDVTLGQPLDYVIKFKNIGNDDAKSFTIRDVLPKNTFYQNIDVSGAPGVTGAYNSVTKEIVFTIPDNKIKTTDPEYTIRIRVQVVNTCSELTDACSNIIQNLAYSTYRGVLNNNQISNDPSVAGVDTCGASVQGPANFLVDIDECAFVQNETLCGASITLKAGNGYASYQWYRTENGVDTPIGNTQSITVSAVGNYKVVNTPTPPCIGITQYFNVTLYGAGAVSPVEAFADEVVQCNNDGDKLGKIFLCGVNDHRLIQTNISNAQSIVWEKLNESSCPAVGVDNCANKNATCSWLPAGTGQNFDATQAGQYRLTVNYQTGGCFNRFYFNVFKNNLDPQVAVKNIICTSNGEIRVLNVPSTYEIKLIKVIGATETVVVDYPNTNPVFPIAATGIYRVEIKQTGVPNGCIFKLDNIGIQKKDLTANIITVNKSCVIPGSITLQALNVEAQYNYRVTNGSVNLLYGPTADATHEFTGLGAGNYTVYITTTDGCSYTGTTTVNDYSTLALNAAVKQSISCDPGQIQLTPSGGLEPYIFAVYTKNGVAQNPGVGDYTIGNPFDVAAGDAGTYVFITKDANGCTVTSNPVTINNIPGITYTTTATNVTCNGANNGTFTFNTTATNGYTVSYEVIDADDDIVGQNTTGVFTGLEPGAYTANLIQTGVSNTCSFSTTFTITQPAALTGTASITTAYTCVTGGATVSVNVPSVTGGTTPYQYSIDGTNFGSATAFTGLTAGTYRITIKDAKGCTLQTAPMTVAPLTSPTNITFTATAVTCPAQTSNVTLAVTGGAAPLNYEIISPSAVNNGTSNVFNGLAPNTYTFRVTDANGCTLERSYTVNPLTPIAVTGVNNNNVRCFGTATGALTFTVTGFGTAYNYTVTSTGTAVPAATGVTNGTVNLTNLAAGTYTMTVTSQSTNCTVTSAVVTIAAPTVALAITKTVTQPTCNAQGKVVIAATGGWGSYQYELTGAATQTNNNGTFNALMPGSYTIKVTDANGCEVTDAFTLTGAVPPVLAIDPSSDLCYDATDQATLTALMASGTGTAPFSYRLNNGTAQTSATFAGLSPGTYTISVVDANNCTASVTQTIYPQMVASAVLVKDQDCSASPAAQIRINIAGGATPYTYAVSIDGGTYSDLGTPSSNPLVYTTSTAGSYTFKYTDANGCSAVTPATIVSPLTQPLITSLTPTGVTCFGSSNGAIAVVINNTQGLSPYTIAVTKTSGTTVNYGTQTTGLPAGNYTVTITDANGCTSLPVTTMITQPDEITYVINKIDISCNNPGGTSFGQIMIQGLSGGTAPYTYYTTNNFGDSLPPYMAPTGEDYSFVILNFGIYKVEVVDANGCSVIVDNITIASPPDDLTIDVAAVTTDCTTGGTAVVTVSAAVVSNNYEFGILTSNTMPYSSAYFPSDSGTPLTRTFTGLTPGVTYTFVVHDLATGCYYFKSAASAVTSPSMVTASVIPKNVTCTNAADGKVSFVISGYDPATTEIKYEIFKSPSTLTTGITATVSGLTGTPYNVNNVGDLIPGDYYILLTELDGNIAGCSNTTSNFTITQSAVQLEVAAKITKNDNCNPAAGIITASAKYGKSGYQYLLLPDNAIPPTAASFAGSTSPIFNADGGNYIVYVKDANDCIVDFPITLPTDSAPDMLPLTVQPNCPANEGESDIYITTLPGGVDPMTFSVNGGAFQQIPGRIIYGLSSGTHTVVMKDANGCTDTESVTIYAPLTIAPLAATQPTCVNTDGVIRASGSGGSASANYRYALETAAGMPVASGNTTGIFTGLIAGDYKVILTDTATPCSKELLVTLDAPVPVTFTTAQTNVSCNAGTDGTITATLDSGNIDTAYSYQYTRTNSPSIIVQADGLFTGLPADTYTVTVTSGKNCVATQTVTITEPAAITVSATATDFACAPDNTVNTAVITITAGGGTGTKLYSIDNGASFFASNTFEVADNGSNQTFDIVVKDANNCEETGTVTVNRLPAITAVAVGQAAEITCTNAETVTLTVTGGSGDFTFDLLPLGTQPSVTPGAGVFTANFDLASIGTYTFKVTDNVTGCTFTTAAYTIAPFDTIEVEAVSAAAVTCFGAADGSITINVTGYTGSYQYEVVDTANAVIVAARTSSVTGAPFVVTNVPAGNYFVRVTANGTPFCTNDTDYITVPGPASALTLTATPNSSVTCTNDKGQITAQAAGGWGTYQYQLINNTTSSTVQAFDTNNIFTDLGAGNYTVSVRDLGNCIVTQTVTFTQPTSITADISASVASVLCYGATTASVEAINVSGGQGVYQYVLNTYNAAGTTIVSSTGSQTSPLFNGLGAGKYSITVTDGWNCGTVPTGIVTINQPDQLVGILDVTTYPTCTTSAQLNLSATGGTPPYQYSEDNVTYNGTNTFTVTPGTYKYYVKDANNCTAVLSNSVTISPVDPVTIDLNLAGAKINCADDTTAVIIAEAAGGLGNYQYELLNSASAVVAGPQADGTFAGLAAGDYTVRVTSGDCSATATVPTIANPAEFVVTPTVVPLLCFGDPSGKIIISTTGGTGTVQYSISPNLDQFDTNNEFDDLAAGDYDVIVQDMNGCFEFLHLTVTEPQPIVANIVILTDETCLGEGDGTVEVDINGGTGSYAYSLDYNETTQTGTWSNFTTPPYIITGIAPGEITINIKDQNNCFLNPPIDDEILPGVDLQPTADVTTDCVNNTPTNTVTVTLNAGVDAANVTYSLDGVTYQPGNVFTNVALAPGTHQAYAKHTMPVTLLECIKTADFTIDVHDPIVASASVTENVDCFEGTTGEIEVTATGGTTPLEYAIATATGTPVFGAYQLSNVFENLSAGSYVVNVRDSISCDVTTAAVTITQPASAVTATITHTDEICINAADGSITIVPAGGVGPYQTSLNGAAFKTDLIYDSLADGTYTIDVKDANECTIVQESVTIAPGVFLNATKEIIDTCTDNIIGNVVFIRIDSSVTAADVTYSLDGGAYQASEAFGDIPAGNHSISVLHANGCEQIVSFTIDTYTAITASANPTNVLCNAAATGEIEVTATGGTGALSYAISDVTPAVFDPADYDTSNVFTGLIAGTYTVSVMDDNLGCETQLTVTITEPAAALAATLTHTDETCFDADNGSITVTISGGTAPYETSLNGAAFVAVTGTTHLFNNLPDDTYTIDVRDDNGCSIAQISETIQNGVDMQPSAVATPNCVANMPNNDVEITIATGFASGDVSYSLDGTTYQPSNVFANVGLAPGTHTAYVKHVNGCVQETTFTIDVHDPIVASAAVTENVDCFNGTTGEIEVTATGGTTPLEYAIAAATGTPVFGAYQLSNVFQNLSAGSYVVNVRDAISCEVSTASVTITQPAAALAATLTHTDETCFDADNGSITVTISGGTAPYEASLDGGTFVAVTGTTQLFDNLQDGLHTIDVRDDNGCSIAQISETIQNGVDMQPSAAAIPNCVANMPNNDVEITIATGFASGDVSYSLDGTTYQPSNIFANVGLAPGTHTAYVQHVNGCIQTTTFTIDVHDPIVASAAVTENVDCYGGTTGEIEVTATGGTTPLEYAISPGYVYGNSNVFTGLTAGTYDVKVKDAISCEITTASVTITEPAAALAATLTHTDETCFDADNGSITVSISGGTAPYEASLNGAAFVAVTGTSQLFNNLQDGSYTIDVRDDNGCSIVQISETIQNGVDMQPSAQATPNCVANMPNNDVEITIATGFASGDVSYSLDGTTYQPSNIFANVSLTVGTHTAYVKHTNGCIQETTFTIDIHDPIVATAAVTENVDCFNGTTGEIEVTATGGTTPLEYAIATATGTPVFGAYQLSNVFENLSAGSYVVNVRDAISCDVTTASVTITEPATAVSATVAHTDEICINANDGTITITPSGGVGPYQTSLNGAAFVTATTYLAVGDGTYTIDVKDANGCTITQQSVTIAPGVFIDAEAEVVPNCNNNIIGNVVFMSVDDSVLGDVEYSLDGGTYQTSEIFADVPVGAHNVSVLHTNGCEQIVPFTIDAYTPITASAAQTDVLCNGAATGEIVVTATGGTGTLTYSISSATPPVFASYDASNIFTGLTAGTYTVSVLDDNLGCETQLTVTITQPASALAASATYTDETCFDANNGTITVTISGGTAPYQTSLNGAAYTTATAFTALADGTYTIDVKDANGCSVTQFTQFIQNGVNMQPSAAVTPNCVNNAPNNDVVITIASGVTGTVTYSIDGTNYQASNTFTNVSLAAGAYTAYAQHANGCIQTTTFTINVHNPVTATAAVTANVLCFGAATGEITVTATGTTPIEYAISPGYVYGTSNVFTGLTAGTYNVKVRDAISCEITTASVTITQPAAALAASATHTDETCFNSNNGTITVTISGGTAPYQTSLNGAAYTTATAFTALADGAYTIDVKDANGCTITQLTQVIQNGVNMQPSAAVTPNCVNNTPNNDVVITIASGVTGAVTYSIDGTNYQVSNTFTNVGLAPGVYNAYAKHANGCIQTTTFTIDVHTPLMHTGTLTLNITCYGNNTGEATLSVAGGTGQLQYAMAPAFVFQTSNLFTGLAPDTYDFIVRDAIGCEIAINDVAITEPFGQLAATLDHTNETCFNSNDGTITVNITGGTPPYFTSLDGAPYVQGQTVYTNLADGTHTINVNDAFACTIPQQSVVIVNGVNMLPVATVTPNCVNNAPDNNVVVNIASGITGTVTYSIDGTNYQASNTFANVGLVAGTYTAYAMHANGCIQQTQFTIAPHAPVTASVASILPELCFGNNTGQITVTASGGTTPLEYAIANENTSPLVYSAYQASNVFAGLGAGTYTISVKDAIGCEVLLTGNVVNGPTTALTASASPTHESCVNDDDGQIDITVSGGTAPYSTSLNGAPFVAGKMNYANLDGGNYTINVQDANGCQIAAPIAVTINEGVQLQASLTVNQVCENVQVTVSVNPTATGTVTYTLDGIYTQSSNVFSSAATPMAAGQHTIAVTHSAGCTEELQFNVAPLVPIVVNYTKTDVACRGIDSGVIVVNPSGGSAPYQYAISYDTLPTPVFTSNNTFDELFGDKDYVIYVKDALGCIAQNTVHLNQPAEKLVITSVTARPETCVLDRNGGIDIVITGGTPPYLTALNSPTENNFQPVTSYNNLYGGTYDVYVKDAAGCVDFVKTVVVENGVDLVPYYETVMSCDNNVPVNRVTVKLRRTVTDVTYALDAAGPFTANNVFELASGQHTIYIKHKNGCQKTLAVTIQDRSPITAQVTPVAAKCNGEASGTITVTPNGGTGALKYAIANANVTPLTFSAFQTSNVFTGLAASNAYVVRIEDAYGCFTEVNGIVVTQPGAIVLAAPVIIQEEICVNDGDAAIELDVPTGGTAPYATSLNQAGPFVTDQYLFDNLQGGRTYTVYVQDANGCIASASVTLAAPMDINATADVVYNCEDNTVTIITDSNIPASQLSYILSGPDGVRAAQAGNGFSNLENGTYTVEVVNTVTGCSDVTAPFVIENATPIVLSVTKTGLNQITANVAGGTGVYRYSFDGYDAGTKNTYTYSRTGRIMVVVTDSRGCTAEMPVDVIFIDIVIPDVMTPDGDGQNDVWSPGNTQNYPNINTDIFDRYGRKLATLKQGQTWDGKYDGNEMPTGDYWYLIKLGDAEDRDFVGHFTIYR